MKNKKTFVISKNSNATSCISQLTDWSNKREVTLEEACTIFHGELESLNSDIVNVKLFDEYLTKEEQKAWDLFSNDETGTVQNPDLKMLQIANIKKEFLKYNAVFVDCGDYDLTLSCK